MKSILRTLAAVVGILVVAICLALIVQKLAGNVRVDLTESRIYTLSEGTHRILAKLSQPVKLKLYYSRAAAMKGPEQIRYYNDYYLYVRDLVDEYVNLSAGKLSLQVIDPRRYSDEEDQAISEGVKRFPMAEDEGFFFGLVAKTELGKEKAIEFFEPGRQEFVEYDISKLISSVVRRDKKKVGVLSPLPVMGANMSPYLMQMMRMQGQTPPPPWTIVSQLRDEYEVTAVEPDVRTVPADTDFLMVVHPKELSERTLFAIDQYVMKGGKLVVFVDPHCITDQPANQANPEARMQQQTSSDLNALLKGWGVEMEPGAIAADQTLAIKTRLRDRAGSLATFIALDERAVNKDEVVTAKLHSVRMLFAGVLKKVPGADTKVVPLLQTTPAGATWRPSNPFELQMPNPEAINRALIPSGSPVMLACRISGKLRTNFPDGILVDDSKDADKDKDPEKPEAEKKGKEPVRLAAVKESSADAAVIVFADVDMISDILAYQQSFFGMGQAGDNASVLLNAVEFLSGTGDLIAIRSRGRFERPFDVVDRIEADAERATAAEKQAIEKKIADYEENLRKLGSSATEENVKLIRSAALADRQKLEDEIRKARKELRALNAGKIEQVDALKSRLQFHNMVWAPAAVLLTAITLAVAHRTRARRYASRRT